jgi:amidohydrolase
MGDSVLAMDFQQIIEKNRPKLDHFEAIYKVLHENPELSCQESRTASVIANLLEEGLHFTTHRNIGGHGVVGVFKNGPGRTVLMRAELDALPVKEESNLPYASHGRMNDTDGEERPVMHACGHDMNMVSLLAAATLLVSARDHWKGVLICLFQPNEECAGGARSMVKDGLYEKIPKPDILLAQHVSPHRAGNVVLQEGAILTAACSLNVRVFGRGGHGSQPQDCIDPVVIAGYIVVRLQSIVSRETAPQETAIVTVGSIHGGSVANVIADYVDLKINVRAYREDLHERLVQRIKSIIQHECEAAQSPRAPEIEIMNRFPPTVNDDGLVRILKESFRNYFKDNSIEAPRPTASEDFSVLADAVGAPFAYWLFGGTDAKKYDEALKSGKVSELPINHSSSYAPIIEPTLRTGTDALALAALTFFEKRTS